MTEKISLCLFILFGTLCIHETLAVKSWNHLIRRKRVINMEDGGDVSCRKENAPYIVNIRRVAPRPISICVGSILSKHTVITVANCVVNLNVSSIQVLAGSLYKFRGVEYNVILKNVHIGNHPRRNGDGIALLTVEPAFLFNHRTGSIQLHQAPLVAHTPATIFGWGYNPTPPIGTSCRDKLRSITVPIMAQRDCVRMYQGHILISDNDVCTYHANKRCGHTDAGAPLVVDNQLAGLYLWRADIPGRNSPDVFVVLESLDYGEWIRNNIIHNVLHISGTQ